MFLICSSELAQSMPSSHRAYSSAQAARGGHMMLDRDRSLFDVCKLLFTVGRQTAGLICEISSNDELKDFDVRTFHTKKPCLYATRGTSRRSSSAPLYRYF